MVQVNAVKQGYYEILDKDGIKIDQKNSEVEAIQGLINYSLLTGFTGSMIPPSYRVDIEGEATSPVVDEIYYAEGYVHLTTKDGIQYIRTLPDKDIIRISNGVARKGQNKFILRRTEDTGGIDNYEIYGEQPFEIENDHEVVDYTTGRIRLWATEPWRIEYWVNGVLDVVASDPADLSPEQYNASLTEEEMYRHTRSVNATYGDKIDIKAFNVAGEEDTFSFYIETLHQLDQSARIKALNEQILLIMQEPEPTE